MDSLGKVVLVLPTKNEIEGMKWFMPLLKKEWFDEILVADGGSCDGTVEYCRDHGYPVFVQTGRGIPNALDEAYDLVRADVYVTATPDGNSLPDVIPRLLEKIRQGCDLVVASRYLGSAKSQDDDFLTALGNKMFTVLVNICFRARYTDTLVGFRAYRREAIEQMRLNRQDRQGWLNRRFFYMNGWELGSSIRARKKNLKVCEIPADEPRRIGGIRKLSIVKNGLGSLLQILRECVVPVPEDQK